MFENLCLQFQLCSAIFLFPSPSPVQLCPNKTLLIKLFKNSVTACSLIQYWGTGSTAAESDSCLLQCPLRPVWPSHINSSVFLPGMGINIPVMFQIVNPPLSPWRTFFCPYFFIYVKSDKSPGRPQSFASAQWPAWCQHSMNASAALERSLLLLCWCHQRCNTIDNEVGRCQSLTSTHLLWPVWLS